MLNTSRTSGAPGEVFTSQRAIDAEGRASSFCRGNNHQLNVLDDVAGYKDAWNASGFVLPTLDATLTSKLTAKRLREL
jgi:hypothetical protein